MKRLETVAPKLMSDIEADMGQLHAQIAVATRRLETSVEQMKSKTTSQLSEIAKSSAAIARLKAEHAERAIAMEAIELKERTMVEQLRTTEANLAVKTNALEEIERKLAQEKAELKDLMAFVDARDKLAESDSRHAAAMDAVRAEKKQVEEQLMRSREECGALQQEMAILKKQVEATWASERIANALLRERINDVAGEVVRVAHALEGLGSRSTRCWPARSPSSTARTIRPNLPTAMTPRACSPTASAPCRSGRRGWHRPGDHRQG